MSTEGTTGMVYFHFVHATYAQCECATVGGIQHGRRTGPDGTAATGPDIISTITCLGRKCGHRLKGLSSTAYVPTDL